jgi:glycosyltransferase involved in cell wall biosynthesis
MKFIVSIIIPVYNAEKFLRSAVESVVHMSEVGEIILIEDGSPDNAIDVCRELQNEYNKVKLYQHPNNENKGAGPSRNLGIEKSTCEFIAFLDADDWYLPDRFAQAKEIFSKYSDADGVYEATGEYDEVTKTLDKNKLLTVYTPVKPEDLLFALVKSDGGRFTTDAITIKRSILEKSGLFDASLRLHQDSHLWLKLAQVGRLYAGELNQPVAIRRTHPHNRYQYTNKQSRSLFYVKTFEWFQQQEKVDPRAYRIIFNRYVSTLGTSIFKRLIVSLMLILKNPSHLKKLI